MQVYLSDRTGHIFKPGKELKGFCKIFLEPGQSTSVLVEIPYEEFRYYDEERNRWHVQPGAYDLLIGSSSRDVRCTVSIEVPPW